MLDKNTKEKNNRAVNYEMKTYKVLDTVQVV